MSIQQLTPAEISQIFQRHRGVQRAIAAELNIRDASISTWLRGRIGSKRIEAACREHAARLLAEESKQAA